MPGAGGAQAEERRLAWRGVVFALCASVAVGLWLFWPSLDLGFFHDDYLHVAKVSGKLPEDGRALFTFAEPRPGAFGPVQGDYLQWWRGEDLLIRFFRPLSSATYYLDHWLWGEDPRGYHVSSLAWYSLVVAGCVLLYAKLAELSGRGAVTVLLAGLVFTTAREHEGNASWLAGRYTLLSVALCVPTLLAYHRWRRAGSRRALAWCAALYAAALCASEMSIALAGYFFAYEVSLARDGWRERVKGILTPVLVAVAWVVLYSSLGYGTKHSLWYIDPLAHFDRFVSVGLRDNLVESVRRLLLPVALEEWPFLQLNAAGHAPCWPGLCWLVAGMGRLLTWCLEHTGALFTYLVAGVLLAGLALQSVRDRAVRFALVGALASLVPLSASPSIQRVMLLPTVGMAWAMAGFAAGAGAALLRPRAWLRPRTLPHAALAAFLLYFLASDWRGARYWLDNRTRAARGMHERALALELPRGDRPDERVLVLTLGTLLDGLYVPLIRRQQGCGRPGGIWTFSPERGLHRVTRTGERSLLLELVPGADGRSLLPLQGAGLRDDFDLPVGTAFRVGALTVRIAGVSGAPGPDGARAVDAVELEIDRPLDDPEVFLVAWGRLADGRAGWRRLVLAVGESAEIDVVPAEG